MFEAVLILYLLKSETCRLDDGSIIGHLDSDVVVKKLTAEEALAQGRLTEKDRQRTKSLLDQTYPVSDPAVGKRKEPETPDGPAGAKRSKARQGSGQKATSNSRASSQDQQTSWAEKCRGILQKVLDSLGTEQQWFDRPVDEFYIPGYYSKVKNPMDLGTMKNKLLNGKYKGPSAFCEDMRQVWDNCISFNGKGSKYGHIGDRTSSYFEEMWAASGLDTGSSRHRRHNAGVPSTKYEEIEEPEPKTRPIRKQQSTRTLNSNKSVRHEDEVTQPPMDRSQMEAIAQWLGGLQEAEMEGAVKILRDHGFGGSGDEIEIDFEALDNETLWALDDYMETQNGKPAAGGKANSGFQVEPESDYESDDSDISD